MGKKTLPETALVVAYYPVRGFLDRFPQYRGSLRFQVFEEKGYYCLDCGLQGRMVVMWIDRGGGLHTDVIGRKRLLTLDHIYPKSLGGPKIIENLQPLCSTCNGKKSDKVLAGVAQWQSK